MQMDAKSLVHQTDDIDAGQYVAVGSWSKVSGPFEVSPKITKAKSQMPKCKKPGKISGMKIAFVLWLACFWGIKIAADDKIPRYPDPMCFSN